MVIHCTIHQHPAITLFNSFQAVTSQQSNARIAVTFQRKRFNIIGLWIVGLQFFTSNVENGSNYTSTQLLHIKLTKFYMVDLESHSLQSNEIIDAIILPNNPRNPTSFR